MNHHIWKNAYLVDFHLSKLINFVLEICTFTRHVQGMWRTAKKEVPIRHGFKIYLMFYLNSHNPTQDVKIHVKFVIEMLICLFNGPKHVTDSLLGKDHKFSSF